MTQHKTYSLIDETMPLSMTCESIKKLDLLSDAS